jgi:hypothetical protein
LLALIAAMGGAALTLTVDQMWLASWFDSGRHFPIGPFATVDLPAGSTLVYYESPVQAPVADVGLYMTDPDGERIRAMNMIDDINYRILLSGWSGRALWKLDVKNPGPHRFRCSNHNYASDDEVPAEDRVTFLKSPQHVQDVSMVRKFIQITGATATVTLVISLYILHGLALRKQATSVSS